MIKIFAIIFLFPVFIHSTSTPLTCRDINNQSVSWFFAYKYPANISEDTPQYAYIDSNSKNGFQFMSAKVDDAGQALPLTIAAINAVEYDYFSLLVWNDEDPSGKTTYTGAHSKGFLAYNNNSNTGIYLMHSAPAFPTVSEYGEIDPTLPDSALEYAQTFYCNSFDETQLGTIVGNLEVIYPVVYWINGEFRLDNFESSKLMQKSSQFNVNNGQIVHFVSKSPNYTTGYLYENIVQPTLKINLEVMSWGRPYLPSICPGTATYSTLNIDYVEFSNSLGWDHYSDHSKWAISSGTNPGYACICDMNRMQAQETRGGSCLCSQNSILYNALNGITKYCDPCSKEKSFLGIEY